MKTHTFISEFLFKKEVLIILISFLFSSFIYAEDFEYTELDGDLYLTDIPVYYGEEYFLERLNSRSSEEPPLGLVFSGGAARAFAHIGVLKKMEEENIYPDFIVANSMGSVVALLYAAGFSPDMIEEMMLDYDTRDLFQLKMPLDGGVLDSEDLFLFFMIFSVNLILKILKFLLQLFQKTLFPAGRWFLWKVISIKFFREASPCLSVFLRLNITV